MFDLFKEKTEELYQLILQPIDSIYKVTAIHYYKRLLEMKDNDSFGHTYYQFVKDNREKGVVYTPKEMCKYLVSETICREDILKNPNLKIVDPACGSGNFILECYLHLYSLFLQSFEELNAKFNLGLVPSMIPSHIIRNNLYGFDIDVLALMALQIDLFEVSGELEIGHFFAEDFLFTDRKIMFEVCIGNPPYVGHKTVDKMYAKRLKEVFYTYKDKGDISYCFYSKALKMLQEDGKLTFITSRYFIESLSGEILRKYIVEQCRIVKMIDFYGNRPFKGTGIDPIIMFLHKSKDKDRLIEVIKPRKDYEKGAREFYRSIFVEPNDDGYAKFHVMQENLNPSGWVLKPWLERELIQKLEKKCITTLEDLCDSHQGIITGCDKAFIVDSHILQEENIERSLVKPWIKSSHIQKSGIFRRDSYIIYTDIVEDETEYPNALKYVNAFRERLMERRECKRGIREWYRLQWGRKQEIFEGKKIVFPYKSSDNRFALDKGSYYSADIYALTIKSPEKIDYEALLCILNSKLYQYYFQSFAKKLGDTVYEYYPNTLMKLKIPVPSERIYHEEELYRYFQLDTTDIQIIENYIP